LLVATRLRHDLHVEAEVSPAILHAVEGVMAIYADWSADFERLWRVKVTADAAVISRTRGHSAGTFFSCALDSTYSLLRNVKRYPADDALTWVLRPRAQRNAGSVSAPGRGFQPSE
jgi:hypothetical protein